MILKILSIMAPVFACAATGYLWTRAGGPFDSRMVGRLALNLGMPCLIFSTLSTIEIGADALARMAAAYAAALACLLAAGLAVVSLLRLPLHTYLPAFASANTGNMGLPLCLFAFGPEGLALGIGVFILSSLFSFTVGWSLYAGRLSVDVLWNNPLIYAILAGLPFVLVDARPPLWLANTTELIGGLAIPLMLLSLGAAIARIDARSALVNSGVAAAKLGAGFAVGCALAHLLGLEGAARGVLIIGCSMPVAVHTYMFAEHFDRSRADAAGLILVSTLIALAALPLVLAVAL